VMPGVDFTKLFGVGQRRSNDLSISPLLRGHLFNKPPDAKSCQAGITWSSGMRPIGFGCPYTPGYRSFPLRK
jgi:hypothetical protein